MEARKIIRIDEEKCDGLKLARIGIRGESQQRDEARSAEPFIIA